MFGAGTILARSATPAPNMGVATVEERSRKVRVVRQRTKGACTPLQF